MFVTVATRRLETWSSTSRRWCLLQVSSAWLSVVISEGQSRVPFVRISWNCRIVRMSSSGMHVSNHRQTQATSTQQREYEKTFACNHTGCSYRAKTNGALSNHKNLVHLKIRNKKCHVCEKRFRDILHLRAHMATHERDGHEMAKCEDCSPNLKRIVSKVLYQMNDKPNEINEMYALLPADHQVLVTGKQWL